MKLSNNLTEDSLNDYIKQKRSQDANIINDNIIVKYCFRSIIPFIIIIIKINILELINFNILNEYLGLNIDFFNI